MGIFELEEKNQYLKFKKYTGWNHRKMDKTEEKVHEPEDRNYLKKGNEIALKSGGKITKCLTFVVSGVPKNVTHSYRKNLEQIMTGNFPNMEKDMNLQI